MKDFGRRQPVLMTVLVFIAGLAMALVLAFPLIAIGVSNDLSLAVSRILAGGILFFLFRYCFAKMKTFKSIPYILPALFFSIWNLVYNPMIGNFPAPLGIEPVLLALAPAVFEEVIFRGISICFLKEKGYNARKVMCISALLFGAVHLTNLAGRDIMNVLVQTGYAVVIGLVFAAIYIRTDDFVTLVLAHFSIDFTNRMFISQSGQTPVLWVILLLVLLVLESVFAFWFVREDEKSLF